MSVPLADDQISVKVNESGWAWMVCGEKLIIWKICQTAVAKVEFTEKIQKLKTQVAKQNIHLPVQRVHREKNKLERPSQNLLDVVFLLKVRRFKYHFSKY